jgi:exodeoxyribonuclease VII small subunit
MPKAQAKEPSFEDIVARLEEIAQKLEAGDTDLERALELFEEGVKLARAGGERLDNAEQRLEILRAGEQTETFEPDG